MSHTIAACGGRHAPEPRQAPLVRMRAPCGRPPRLRRGLRLLQLPAFQARRPLRRGGLRRALAHAAKLSRHLAALQCIDVRRPCRDAAHARSAYAGIPNAPMPATLKKVLLRAGHAWWQMRGAPAVSGAEAGPPATPACAHMERCHVASNTLLPDNRGASFRHTHQAARSLSRWRVLIRALLAFLLHAQQMQARALVHCRLSLPSA